MNNLTNNNAKGPLAFASVIRKLPTIGAGLFALAVLAGCASTKISNREVLVSEKISKPANILVYDFGSTPADIPGESALASHASAPVTPPSPEHAKLGRELGTQIATELAQKIHDMGMPATRVSTPTTPQINDIVIRGYLVSIEEGSAAKRVTIGFGSGGSELTTMVEGYQMTGKGLRKLGSGTTDATGGQSPGAGLGVVGLIATGNPIGLVVSGGMKAYGEVSGSSTVEGRAKQTAEEIAQVLRQRFIEQGWIKR
jgi:hypothetical protein